MNEIDYRVLLDPVVAALDEFLQVAETQPAAQGELDSARQFVEYKAYATLHLGAQIRELLATGTAVVEVIDSPERRGAPPVVVIPDKEARFCLYVLVDGFLFESTSFRDALLQLVNVAFRVGIAEDDPQIGNKITSALGVADGTITGLEEWVRPARRPDWLAWLFELRNIVTHRRVVRLPEQLSMTHDGITGPSWHSEVGIAAANGGFEPVAEFIARLETHITALLADSLRRLTQALKASLNIP